MPRRGIDSAGVIVNDRQRMITMRCKQLDDAEPEGNQDQGGYGEDDQSAQEFFRMEKTDDDANRKERQREENQQTADAHRKRHAYDDAIRLQIDGSLIIDDSVIYSALAHKASYNVPLDKCTGSEMGQSRFRNRLTPPASPAPPRETRLFIILRGCAGAPPNAARWMEARFLQNTRVPPKTRRKGTAHRIDISISPSPFPAPHAPPRETRLFIIFPSPPT